MIKNSKENKSNINKDLKKSKKFIEINDKKVCLDDYLNKVVTVCTKRYNKNDIDYLFLYQYDEKCLYFLDLQGSRCKKHYYEILYISAEIPQKVPSKMINILKKMGKVESKLFSIRQMEDELNDTIKTESIELYKTRNSITPSEVRDIILPMMKDYQCEFTNEKISFYVYFRIANNKIIGSNLKEVTFELSYCDWDARWNNPENNCMISREYDGELFIETETDEYKRQVEEWEEKAKRYIHISNKKGLEKFCKIKTNSSIELGDKGTFTYSHFLSFEFDKENQLTCSKTNIIKYFNKILKHIYLSNLPSNIKFDMDRYYRF